VQGDKLSYCGWPEGQAELKDCVLIKEATQAERLALLHEMAKISESDHRQRYAVARLATLSA
jgi:hypothetical protein